MSVRKRLFAILLATNYLFLTVVGSLLHHPSHVCGECNGHSGAIPCALLEESCCRPHETDDHCTRKSEHSDEQMPANSSEHQNCPICRFLANSPMIAGHVPDVTWTALEFATSPATPPPPIVHVRHVWQSRAPPAVA